MPFSSRHAEAITRAVEQAKANHPGAGREVIATFDDGEWSDERFIISVESRTVTVETLGQMFDADLRGEILSALSRQTGATYEVFPYVNSIGYDFAVE